MRRLNESAKILRELLAERILVLDGAMGTMLQQRNLTAADFGGPALEGCNENLVRTRPDVVLVAGPDYTHCEHTVGALEAGCDVIVEKPMVINSEQLRRVIAAEKRSGP